MNKGKPSKPLANERPPKFDAGRSRIGRRSAASGAGARELREGENASGPRVPKRLAGAGRSAAAPQARRNRRGDRKAK